VSSPWRRFVAVLALAGFFVSGVAGDAPRPACAAEAAADSTAATGVPAPSLQAKQLVPPPRSQTLAWIALGTGLAAGIASFGVARSADRAYDAYLVETDPSKIEDHYQKANRLDRTASVLLVGGQAAIAFGLYWKFIRRPREAHARTIGVAPSYEAGRLGVAVVVPLP
jgi:hypothetical protein